MPRRSIGESRKGAWLPPESASTKESIPHCSHQTTGDHLGKLTWGLANTVAKAAKSDKLGAGNGTRTVGVIGMAGKSLLETVALTRRKPIDRVLQVGTTSNE